MDFKALYGTPKNYWGGRCWRWLHLLTINYPTNPSYQDKLWILQQLQYFASSLPCAECQNHFSELMRKYPPNLQCGGSDFGNPSPLERWSWGIHNRVNERLGKRLITLREYTHIYYEERAKIYKNFI